MKSAPAVSCGGPRSNWGQERQALEKRRSPGRWIGAALLLALALAVVALLIADPASADPAMTAGLGVFSSRA